jgi:HTH-type transcriptional repressor of NAD biosynthesis genes
MVRGLVLGKFMPVHTGHVELITFASEKCDELIVWICVSDRETMPAHIRHKWISEVFAHNDKIKPVVFIYYEKDLPNTSESSKEISKKWSKAIQKSLPGIDLIFTAEPYGEFVANFLNIKHIPFPENKGISASQIRSNPYKYWKFLPVPVKKYYFKKVAVLGTESTGKTELTKKLAHHYQSDFVSEAGRDIVDITEQCTWSDLENISVQHAKAILLKERELNKLLFIDTDITITQSYARFLFNKSLEVDNWIVEANKCDVYLYLSNDAPFVQDGTRLTLEERNRLHFSHINLLKEKNIAIEIITGSWDERFQKAIDVLDNKLFKYSSNEAIT